MNWPLEINSFLSELESAQENAMAVLKRKQEMLASADVEGMKAIAEEEKTAVDRLDACLKRRESLLRTAALTGMPSDSIEQLCRSLPKETGLNERIRRSIQRTRSIQFQSLTNWVLAQRSVLHLNQLLEMIEFKGALAPTYGRDKKKESGNGGGNLVDRVA